MRILRGLIFVFLVLGTIILGSVAGVKGGESSAKCASVEALAGGNMKYQSGDRVQILGVAFVHPLDDWILAERGRYLYALYTRPDFRGESPCVVLLSASEIPIGCNVLISGVWENSQIRVVGWQKL